MRFISIEIFLSVVITYGKFKVLIVWHDIILSNIEVYEIKNGNGTFKENTGFYNHEQFSDG